MACAGSAWCPGGRRPQKPMGAAPREQRSTRAHAPPAACSGRLVGARAGQRVGVELPPRARIARSAPRGSRGAPASSSGVGGRRLAALVAEPVARLQRPLDGRDPAGPLRVGPGVVAERGLVPEVNGVGDADTVVPAPWRATAQISFAPTSQWLVQVPRASTPRSARALRRERRARVAIAAGRVRELLGPGRRRRRAGRGRLARLPHADTIAAGRGLCRLSAVEGAVQGRARARARARAPGRALRRRPARRAGARPRGRPLPRRVAHAGGSATGRRITRQLSALAAGTTAHRGARGRPRRRPLDHGRPLPSGRPGADGRAVVARGHDPGHRRRRRAVGADHQPRGAIGAGMSLAHAGAPRWPTSRCSSSTPPRWPTTSTTAS